MILVSWIGKILAGRALKTAFGRFVGGSGSFITSRGGIVLTVLLMVLLSLFVWHKLDKQSAVRKAVVQYVAKVELEAAEAEANKLREIYARAQAANVALQQRINQAEMEVADANERINRFVAENPSSNSCRVPSDFLDLLRAN